MQKRDDSIRALGFVTVAVDKPLRAEIKEMAAKKGLTMVDYIRLKVEEDKKANPQGIMAPMSARTPATKQDIDNAIGRILNRLAVAEEKHLPNGPDFFRLITAPEKAPYTPAMLKADVMAKKAELNALLDKAKQFGIPVEQLNLESGS